MSDKNKDKEQLDNETTETIKSKEITTDEDNNDVQLELSDFMGNGNDVFTTYKQKYENTMSSAVILLLFGSLGIISMILFITGIIPSAMSSFQYVFLTILYLIFIGYGVISYLKAKDYKLHILEETTNETNITTYLEEHVTEELLEQYRDEEITEEENYLVTITKIRDSILEIYPTYDEKHVEYMIDNYLNENY